METIAHRDLRNNSSQILARVARGEAFQVTNRGETVAVISPPQPESTELQRLRSAGRIKPAGRLRRPLSELPRAAGVDSQELLDDIRGRW